MSTRMFHDCMDEVYLCNSYAEVELLMENRKMRNIVAESELAFTLGTINQKKKVLWGVFPSREVRKDSIWKLLPRKIRMGCVLASSKIIREDGMLVEPRTKYEVNGIKYQMLFPSKCRIEGEQMCCVSGERQPVKILRLVSDKQLERTNAEGGLVFQSQEHFRSYLSYFLGMKLQQHFIDQANVERMNMKKWEKNILCSGFARQILDEKANNLAVKVLAHVVSYV